MLSSFAGSRFLRPLVFGLTLALYASSGFAGCNPERERADSERDLADAHSDASGQGEIGRETDLDDPTSASNDPRPAVLFLGNSLTAGLGVDPADAFPSLIQRKIDQAPYALRVINAGVSGETTGGGLSRIDWLLENQIVALVLELGANDGLRGAPPEAVEENLQAIIDRARARHPGLPIVLAGMQAPPNMGRTYADAFRDVFPRLANRNGIALIPFLLEGVAAERQLNQADGIHPTAEGHAILAETVWATLEPVLDQLVER